MSNDMQAYAHRQREVGRAVYTRGVPSMRVIEMSSDSTALAGRAKPANVGPDDAVNTSLPSCSTETRARNRHFLTYPIGSSAHACAWLSRWSTG